mgnify:CR=1 FL=1
MQCTDSGIVLGARRLGESSVILELMTIGHGRHLGLVRGGRGKRYAAMLQPGNTVRAVWWCLVQGCDRALLDSRATDWSRL